MLSYELCAVFFFNARLGRGTEMLLTFTSVSTFIVLRMSSLTLARTCYFPILERTWGVATPPHAISPLIEIELWDKDQTNLWDVLNLMVPGLTSLGHILTPPGRVKEKKIAI